MSTGNGMKRRTRITLALAALTTFAFGATYGLVAHEGVGQQAAVAAVAAQASAATAPAQGAPSVVEQDTGGSTQQAPAAAPVPHTTTRAT